MKTILITGASRGLGLALTEQFSILDCSLLLVVRSANAKRDLQQCFPMADVLVCDVTYDGYEEKLATWLGNRAIDVVINNAGSGTVAPDLGSTIAPNLRKEFETNCIAVLSTVKACLNGLKRAAQPLVVNISSRRGSLTLQSQLAAKNTGCSYSYRISKAAQNMLSLCLADELEELGIRIVSIHPGRLLTDMASSDAYMTPAQSAEKLVYLIKQDKLKSRDYICLETGKLPW